MKKLLFFLLIVPVFVAFDDNTDRPDLIPETINGKGVYILSVPAHPYEIVATEELYLGTEQSYTQQLKAFTEVRKVAAQDYDALLSRDGKHVHLIKYKTPTTHRGEAIQYGNWHFFFLSTPIHATETVAQLDFDQTLGPDRDHLQLMTQLIEMLQQEERTFNAVTLDGKGSVTLLSLQP